MRILGIETYDGSLRIVIGYALEGIMAGVL